MTDTPRRSRFRFCPTCGSTLEWVWLEGRWRQRCRACRHVFYRNAKPGAAGLVLRGRTALLVRRASPPYRDHWDIPGGFLEADELPEAALVREVREETGLEVRPVEFLGAYLDRYLEDGDDDDLVLSLFYRCEEVGGAARAGTDAAALGWFSLDALPEAIAFTWSRPALEAYARRLQWVRRAGPDGY